ncbi:MAG TPA: TonB-dependent receptor, partial [Rhizomicrobium sp.]|nr:TonB-dependent receptor [Rhizomicrobium sp.]
YLTGPIFDEDDLSFRLTGVWAQHDPYTKNLSTAPTANHRLNAQDFYSIRGQILWKMTDNADLLLQASVNHNNDIVSPNTTWYQVPTRYMTGATPIPAGSACDFSTAARYKARTVCHDAPESAYNTLALYSATFNVHWDWATFTSQTAISTSDVSQVSDGDGSNLPMALGDPWILKQHQISEEARLASNDDSSPLKWIAGFYYFWSDNYEDFAYSDSGLNDTFPLPGIFDAFNFLSHGNTKTESYAPFGQLDLDLGKMSTGIPLTITLGLRYSHDKKYGYNYLDYQLPFACGGSCGVFQGPFSKSWAQTTGKFGLAYQVDEDLMVYGSASRGYLAGGNIIGLANVYNPETMWSYEGGFKSTFWDDRAQLNVAGYHEEIKNLQVFIQDSTHSGINNVNGLTQVNGLETELTLSPIDKMQINATLTLTSAHYGQYITTEARIVPAPVSMGCTWQSNGTPTGGTLCNFKGNNLNQTPPYSFNLGAQYTFDTDVGTITPRVDAYFSGRVDFIPDNIVSQGSYTQTNIHVTWESPDEMYKAEAFVNNLEDKNVISNDGLQSVTLGQQALEPDNFAYYAPRTFGLRLGVKF